MDVRCERCQTEYELEDASVSDLGRQVQCGDCGHLFVVKRPASPAAGQNGQADTESQQDGLWLETVKGHSHRLRDLSVLHRWIIERRVLREDRISSDGRTWKTLAEVAELRPIFDVVDAERTKASDTPAPQAVALPVPFAPPVAAAPAPARSPRPTSPTILSKQPKRGKGALPQTVETGETALVRFESGKSRGALKVVVMVLVAGVVAFVGIGSQRYGLAPIAKASRVSEGVRAAQPQVTSPAAEAALVGREAMATGEKRTVESGARAPIVEPLADEHGERASGASRDAAKAVRKAHASVAAAAYSALGRRQYNQAILLFKHALSSSPSNGTILFGLAEAYRGGGQKMLALQTYRRYLDILPAGPQAASARAHVRLLEGKRR